MSVAATDLYAMEDRAVAAEKLVAKLREEKAILAQALLDLRNTTAKIIRVPDDRTAELEEQNRVLLANQERLVAERTRCRCGKQNAA